MARFITPVTVRLPISEGDWIEIADRLTVGEQKRIDVSGLKRMEPGKGKDEASKIETDFAEFSFARTATYIKAWSLVKDGQSVPVSRASIEALDPETYLEIENAITAHVEARAEAKKTQAGSPPSTAS